MWNNNNQQPGYGAPPPSFPNYNPSSAPNYQNQQPGYQAGYAPSYGPPPGPPGQYGPPSGYGPPPGPPPPGPPPSSYGPHGYAPAGGYQPLPGPPQGYGAPPGPPPSHPSSYGPPPGPPPHNTGFPGDQYRQQANAGYPGQYHNYNANSYHPPPQNYYPPPAGPPPMPPTQIQHYGPQVPGDGNRNAQPFYQYSQCNGRKKGLFVGINYFNQDGELHGCINDVKNITNFLIERYGYKREDMVILTDDQQNPRSRPTRQNIIQAMHWLVGGAQPNDSLFFHYSGHGGQTKDLDGDEADGFDEVIYPEDFEAAGHIVDDEMHFIMVKPLPPGCRLTAIFDSCHSGTALDLPFVYSTEGKIKEPNLAAEAGQGLIKAASSYAKGDMGGVLQTAIGFVKTAANTQKAEQISKATRTSPADCISFSGCKDDQTSADTQEAGQATGAMSYAFIAALNANPQVSYQQLLINIREILRAKYSQKPQFSSSHPMDVSLMFIC